MINEIKKFAYIDALRGLAVVAVVFHHTAEFTTPGNNLFFNQLVENTTFGVQLFYIVSAFTLSMSSDKRKEKLKITNFFIRRFFRIFPLYYLAIIFYTCWGETFATRQWLEIGEHITTYNILSNVFFIHQLNPSWINSVVPGGWSVAIEMSFYVIFPFITCKIKNPTNALFLFLTSFYIMIAANKLLNHFPLTDDLHLNAAYKYFYLPAQLPVFSLGILFFYVAKDRVFQQISNTKSIFMILLIGFTLSKFIIPFHITISFLLVCLIYFLSKNKCTWMVNKLTIKVGELSFGIYLFHYAVFYLLHKYGINLSVTKVPIINYLISFACCLLLTSVVAYFLNLLIEKPFISYGKRIISEIEKIHS